MEEETISKDILQRGVSRRDFLKFCTVMAATLGLPSTFVPKIAEAIEKKPKPYAVWLEFQDCAGDTESFLRATKPTAAQLILNSISLNYHETIMTPAGHQAEKSLDDVVKNQEGKYLAVVEGAIPLKDGGVYCTVGGRTAIDIVREVCGNALATIAVGNCATFGGIPAAHPNPTGAVSVKEAVSGITLINLPGCPMNVQNLTATIVNYLTFGSWPAIDELQRPYFAYGIRIHDNCERRAHFEAGQFVRRWGDEGARLGWCLYEMGCKGPVAHNNCPTIRWNQGTSWPVMAGHGCIACAAPDNWDMAYPFYERLPNIPGFGIQSNADKIGLIAVGVAAAGITAHAIGRSIQRLRIPKKPEVKVEPPKKAEIEGL
jgi:hydrogenase small subunit